MAYSVKVTGAASFKPINLQCPECKYEEEQSIDLRGLDEEQKELALNPEIKCPNCEDAIMQKIWRGAPSIGNFTNERSSSTIDARKKSFKQRLKKTDDDVRHKFGRLYDDSLNSAAAQRIKKKLNDGVAKKKS